MAYAPIASRTDYPFARFYLAQQKRGTVLWRHRPMWNKIMAKIVGFTGVFVLVGVLMIRIRLDALLPLRRLDLAVQLNWIVVLYLFRLITLTIRADGIGYGGHVIKWEQIKSYRWDGKAVCTLRLTLRSTPNLSWFAHQRNAHWHKGMIIPPDRKEAIDKVLAQYILQAS